MFITFASAINSVPHCMVYVRAHTKYVTRQTIFVCKSALLRGCFFAFTFTFTSMREKFVVVYRHSPLVSSSRSNNQTAMHNDVVVLCLC